MDKTIFKMDCRLTEGKGKSSFPELLTSFGSGMKEWALPALFFS
jgi:hypothetical protein